MNLEQRMATTGAGGPVAMARTAQGTVYLYDIGADDLQAYAALVGSSATERVRWLLTRIASRGASGPLSDDEVATMGEADIESLAEQFLDTPQMRQRAATLGVQGPMKRAASESAIAFLDRLLRRPEAAPVAPAAAPVDPTRTRDARRLLSWGIAAVTMGCVLSGLAALFTYRGYEREVALEAEVQRLRAEVGMRTKQRDAEVQAALQGMQAQNQDLGARMDRLEARPAPRAAEKAPARAAPMPAPRFPKPRPRPYYR